MGLMNFVFGAAVNLLLLAADIVFLLLLVRVLRRWSSNSILVAFDNAGIPIVEKVMGVTDRLWVLLRMRRPLSNRGRLAMTILILTAVRFGISLLCIHPR